MTVNGHHRETSRVAAGGRDGLEQRLEVPSESGQVPLVQERVGRLVEEAGWSREAVFAVKLALEEAVSNAIRHGNGRDPSKRVVVEWDVKPDQVELRVCDQGGGFCPSCVPDPTLDENLCLPHGRGVMLMRAYMSDVTFNDRGNCVTMIKRRDEPGPRVNGV